MQGDAREDMVEVVRAERGIAMYRLYGRLGVEMARCEAAWGEG